jgi:type IV pilus assembly protein PilB
MAEKKKLRLTLGEILLQVTSLTPEQLKEALGTQQEKEMIKLIGQVLIDKGYVTEQDVVTALAIQYGYPYIHLSNYNIDSEVAKIIPREFAEKYKLIPLEKIGNTLTVAMATTFDKLAIKEMEEKYGYKIRTFLASLDDLEEAIRRYYS